MSHPMVVLCLLTATVLAHQPNPDVGITEEEKQAFLRIHNEARADQGSSNMYQLEWDDHLAILAWRWANHCNFTHGQIDNDYGSQIGQNLYMTEGETNKYGSVSIWMAESYYYDYDTGECEKPPCGHYTQGAWARSYKVGCAHAQCAKLWWPNKKKYLDNAQNIVCHYWPAGNIAGMKPFKKGPACSECENGKGWCNNGLCQEFCEEEGPGCECTGQLTCANCGQTDRDTCSCKCAKGFQGKHCNEVCRNLDERCPQFKRGHCENAKYGQTIRHLCPAVCGVCEYQDDKSWTCQGKTWADVFGVVDAYVSSDELGCVFPFVYQGRYHDSCVLDERLGREICSTSVDMDVYGGYKNCTVTRTTGGTAHDAPCHFPFIYEGRKHYRCIQILTSHWYWCGTTRDFDTDQKFGVCIRERTDSES